MRSNAANCPPFYRGGASHPAGAMLPGHSADHVSGATLWEPLHAGRPRHLTDIIGVLCGMLNWIPVKGGTFARLGQGWQQLSFPQTLKLR